MRTKISQTTNKNNTQYNSSQSYENCESSTISEDYNTSSNQQKSLLSSPNTQPIDGSNIKNGSDLEFENFLSYSQKILKKDSLTIHELETKFTLTASKNILTHNEIDIQQEDQNKKQISKLDKLQNNKKHKFICQDHIQTVKISKQNKQKKRKCISESEGKTEYENCSEENNQDEILNKKKKIRKACRFNYIEHYIPHHQLSHRIETDEIIFENEFFIPNNYQTNQYFNGNPLSFFTLVNLHKRIQKVEHIFNNKKKGSQGQQQQSQSQNKSLKQLNNNNINQSKSSLIDNQQTKPSETSSSKKGKNKQTNNPITTHYGSNQLHKQKDYVNIVFEDRTHFQKSSLNQFVKKIKSLPGKGATLYSEAIQDFIQNKISLQKTVSYDLLDNFIDGLGNFYLLRVFKQTSTDLIIDHYKISSPLIKLLGFETSTFCSFVIANGVPYIHDVKGNYLEYMAQCIKSWVRSSENITQDTTLICADSLRVQCSENIYTRTFHNAEKQEHYLVETHVFRPKKSDSKDYLLSDDRISLFQKSFAPLIIQNSNQYLDQQNTLVDRNINHQINKIQINEQQDNNSSQDFLSSLIINLTQKSQNNNNAYHDQIKKQTLKRKFIEIPQLNESDFDGSDQNKCTKKCFSNINQFEQ